MNLPLPMQMRSAGFVRCLPMDCLGLNREAVWLLRYRAPKGRNSLAQHGAAGRVLGKVEVGSESRRDGTELGGSNSVVESQPSKLLVAGSIPVSRSKSLKV